VPGADYATEDLRFSIVYRARCFSSEEERARYGAQLQRGRRPGSAAGAVENAAPADEVGEEEDSSSSSSSSDGMLPLESILDRLIVDMVARGRARDRTALDAIPRLDLALALMGEYIRYPLPTAAAALLPWNYCVASKVLPAWLVPAVEALVLQPLGCGAP
jgi:hypothetical protein